jgi:hypothetical protein
MSASSTIFSDPNYPEYLNLGKGVGVVTYQPADEGWYDELYTEILEVMTMWGTVRSRNYNPSFTQWLQSKYFFERKRPCGIEVYVNGDDDDMEDLRRLKALCEGVDTTYDGKPASRCHLLAIMSPDEPGMDRLSERLYLVTAPGNIVEVRGRNISWKDKEGNTIKIIVRIAIDRSRVMEGLRAIYRRPY